jgi:hypothetical protein
LSKSWKKKTITFWHIRSRFSWSHRSDLSFHNWFKRF